MSISKTLLSLSPPPPSPSIYLPKTHLSFTHKPFFPLCTGRLDHFTLKASTTDNGAGVSATIEEPQKQEESVDSNGAVGVQSVEVVAKFEEPRWINGTWDLKQFQKDGQTNWDAVIDAGQFLGFCFVCV